MKPIIFSPIKYISKRDYRIPTPKKLREWTHPVNPNQDIFIRPKEIDLKVKLILNQYPQMDLNDYRRLSETEKNLLQIKAKYLPKGDIKDKADINDAIALTHTIIKKLDEEYGKGKYVFCSIGRSPALFANVLEAMGIESKICRYSAREDYSEFSSYSIITDKHEKLPHIYGEYKDYLANMGLDSKTIENSDKTYVFVDYVLGGHNLKTFQEIIEDPTIGLKLDNVKFKNMNKFFYDESSLKKRGVDETCQRYLDYMGNSTFKSYAIVPADKSIPFIQRQYSHVRNKPWNDEIKIFRFALFDKILGGGKASTKH